MQGRARPVTSAGDAGQAWVLLVSNGTACTRAVQLVVRRASRPRLRDAEAAMDEFTTIPVADPLAELPLTASLRVRAVTLIAILVPLFGVAAAPWFVWGWGFSQTDLWLLVAMYLLTTLGVTVGFHRLFVHHSFDTYGWIRFLLAVFGSMAVQGSLFQWVGLHRLHHQFSDRPQDPHTPHHHGTGVAGLLRGFWHAHIGWFFDPTPPDLDRYVKDLAASRALRVASALFPLWVVLSLLLPAMVGGLIKQEWNGVWTGFIWGGLVRVFLVHHVTWSVNSACHLWGMRPYQSDDMSRNNVVFAILGLGEGWHNTHHAFPTSARHGLRWWQLDVSYRLIRLLSLVGLAWNLKIPTKEAQAKVRRASLTGGTGGAGPSPPSPVH
jgi:stearoyl-CoA desaturase (delta-9 desaturase)